MGLTPGNIPRESMSETGIIISIGLINLLLGMVVRIYQKIIGDMHIFIFKKCREFFAAVVLKIIAKINVSQFFHPRFDISILNILQALRTDNRPVRRGCGTSTTTRSKVSSTAPAPNMSTYGLRKFRRIKLYFVGFDF